MRGLRRSLYNNKLSGPIPSLDKLKVGSVKIAGNSFAGGEGTACSDPSSSKTILLTGAAVLTAQMGLYTEVDITADNEYPERGGRPAFYGQGVYLYYLNSLYGQLGNTYWIIGSSFGRNDMAVEIIMYAFSSALHPTAINAEWKEWNGNAWVSAPDVKVTCVRQ